MIVTVQNMALSLNVHGYRIERSALYIEITVARRRNI